MTGGVWGLWLLFYRFRHKDHFRRLVPKRRPVEISVLRRNLESAASKQVLHFVPEEISRRPGEHQPLLTPVPMRDDKNHLHVIPLLRAMERRHSLADAYAPSVRGFAFAQRHFRHVHGIVHAPRTRREHVPDAPPAARKVLANAR